MAPWGLMDDNQTLVSEREDEFRNFPTFHLVVSAHELARLEIKAAGKDRKALKHGFLARFKEIIAPVNQRSQRLLAWKCDPRSSGQEEEPLVQPRLDLFDGHRADTRGSKLDR